MRYRPLGKTGLSVSEIGFGAEWIGPMSDAEVSALAHGFSDAGVNIVDCWMCDPEVRSALGRALADNRDHWIIQGHLGSTWQNGQYVRSRNLAVVRPAFEDLLKRLQTDHVELGMIHYVDRVEEFHEIMAGEFYGYVEELLAAGAIEHVGLSTHNPDVGALAAADGRIEMILFSVNPAFDLMPASTELEPLLEGVYDGMAEAIEPARARLYALCETHGVGITVMKSYAGGRLLDAKKSPFGVALTPVQCLHYALTRPAVASVLVGVESLEQLETALAYETADTSALDYASVLAAAPAHAYYGQCTYCGHCQPCTVDINIALVNKFYDLADLGEEPPASVEAHYKALDVTAAACIHCGQCEPRCPFGVPIMKRMDDAVALFGL